MERNPSPQKLHGMKLFGTLCEMVLKKKIPGPQGTKQIDYKKILQPHETGEHWG